jgi:hypothetical protein
MKGKKKRKTNVNRFVRIVRANRGQCGREDNKVTRIVWRKQLLYLDRWEAAMAKTMSTSPNIQKYNCAADRRCRGFKDRFLSLLKN